MSNKEKPMKNVAQNVKKILSKTKDTPPQTDASDTSSIRAIIHADSKTNPTDELIAVIVTIRSGSSYDDMYTHVAQQGPEGTRIAVWAADFNALIPIVERLTATSPTVSSATKQKEEKAVGPEVPLASSTTATTTTATATATTATSTVSASSTSSSSSSSSATSSASAVSPFEQLLKDIAEVELDSVVFNFECCSGCSDSGFEKKHIMSNIDTLIKRGHTVMCSDFSLKALIAQWKQETAPGLGPNPFRQVGTFNQMHTLAFDPEVLAKCCSTQLQKVGDLCKGGQAVVKALGGTILYSANKGIADTSEYKMEVLTIVSAAPGLDLATIPPAETWSVKDTKGLCGHTVLTYPSGGKLITSCGHWIELASLDVSEEALLRVAKAEYGEQYLQELENEMTSAPDAQSRKMVVQSRAARMVQSSVPQEYSKGYGRSRADYRNKEQ